MVVQLLNLLSVELGVLKENIHLVEAIDGSRVASDIRPVSYSDILDAIMMQSTVLTCQKDDETELQHHHKECDQETESAEVLRQPEIRESIHWPVPQEIS